VATVFITSSTDGLGRAASQSLLDDSHEVVLHARSADRAATIGEVASRSAGIVIGDLRSASEIRTSRCSAQRLDALSAITRRQDCRRRDRPK
jgi:NAD(P)-dependent dehydrogenase (short-subunit alcohol dehydrogenase family)